MIFLSSYYNHHQQFLSDAFYQKDPTYRFIETSEMTEARRALGYGTGQLPAYVQPYRAGKDVDREEIEKADVVLIGSAPEALLTERKEQKKLIFRYEERPLKKGRQLWKYPYRYFKWHRENPADQPVYMLCASAYTAADYARFHLFRNKTYKWGYFPQCIRYDKQTLFSQKDRTKILWCGRFLDWKHPDDALGVARRLKDAGIPFTMELIGTGVMEEALRQKIGASGLEDCVSMPGPMKPEQVRHRMEQAGIYLLTSDRQEGWGAVLNESMNSGCAVVASHAAGSVPYLVEHEKNGLIYRSGDVDMLCRAVTDLLQNPEKQRILGEKAYDTIVGMWNPEVAAERFFTLAGHILNGEEAPDLYQTGPCSKAEILSERWFKNE